MTGEWPPCVFTSLPFLGEKLTATVEIDTAHHVSGPNVRAKFHPCRLCSFCCVRVEAEEKEESEDGDSKN